MYGALLGMIAVCSRCCKMSKKLVAGHHHLYSHHAVQRHIAQFGQLVWEITTGIDNNHQSSDNAGVSYKYKDMAT
ncbi:hypothetical protein ACOSQ4_016002 [Xanthoceras sorbifolium]